MTLEPDGRAGTCCKKAGRSFAYTMTGQGRSPLGCSWTCVDTSYANSSFNVASQDYTETGSGSGVWKTIGASRQQITASSLTIDGTAVNVWTLEEPGSWKMHFYRGGVTQYDGLLLAEEDSFGNLHTYQYALFG